MSTSHITNEDVKKATTFGKSKLEAIVAMQKAKPVLDNDSKYMLALAEMAIATLTGEVVDVENHPFNALYYKNLESIKRSQLR